MNEATFTFRVEQSLKNKFTDAAKARDRTGAQLLRDFMRGVVNQQQDAAEYDAWFRREVEAGIAEADAGDLVPAEEVETEAAAWHAKTLRKLAGHGA